MKYQAYKEHIETVLTRDEVYTIGQILQREPNDFELNMFAAMWSEHISYKSSAKWIDELPLEGDRIRIPALVENAGVIDLNEEYACVVKMESHNHPTAVNAETASGAVANIYRDIAAMGAKPLALLNVLRFGKPDEPAIRSFMNRVLSSLGSYSNNYGTPVVGGELLFGESYRYTPLLNLMAVGLVRKDRIITASFKERGDKVFLIGGKTTGSGVHGAGFASRPLSSRLAHLVPESQLADPVAGKTLAECLQEMNQAGLISGMQDIAAGGVLCAASEMAFRGGKGIHLFLEDIPVEDDTLQPIDILLSQSQDQMLISVNEEDTGRIKQIAKRWKMQLAEVGEVKPHGNIKVLHKKETLAELPVSSLVKGGGAPVYIRNLSTESRKIVSVAADDVPFPGNLKDVAQQLIQHHNIASRKFVYEQFDTMAGYSCQGANFPADAGIVCLPGHDEMLALSVDGNSRYVRTEPRIGSMIAVAEAARNIVCSGGKPLALTNGLNFGAPGDLHVYRDFVESVKGIKQISERMGIPVIAGNVSFNNVYSGEEGSVSVQPTPVIGMVGLISSKDKLMPVSFKNKGDMIYLIGESDNDISGSEYLATMHLVEETSAPRLDIDREVRLLELMSELIDKRLVSSAHDISLGGLFVALLECCLSSQLGFDVTSPAEVRTDAFLFGESQSRILISVNSENENSFLDFMIEKKFPFSALGHVTKQELRIDDKSFGFITDYIKLYQEALGKLINEKGG